MARYKSLVLLLFCAAQFWTAGSGWCQISITHSDFQSLLGKSQRSESVSVNMNFEVGTGGGMKSWDFTMPGMQLSDNITSYLRPEDTPYSGQFPAANFTLKFEALTLQVTTYFYMVVSESGTSLLGSVIIGGGSTLVVPVTSTGVNPFPLTFGSQWVSSVVIGPLEVSPGIVTKDSTVADNIIDAWGTIHLPWGAVECLRKCSFETQYTKAWFNGTPFSADTSRRTSYSWLAKEHIEVASLPQVGREVSPGVFEISAFSRLFSPTQTSVETRSDQPSLPTSFALDQNFPNPFNPSTQIRFSIERSGHVEVIIHDVRGTQVKSLISRPLPAGAHAVQWDGTDESGNRVASGRYVYTLIVDGINRSKVMTLVK